MNVLDLTLIRNSHISFDIYRKPTFTVLYFTVYYCIYDIIIMIHRVLSRPLSTGKNNVY